MDSFIGWIGGKKLLRKTICEQFPTDIKKYIEVFGGAGWILFHREKYADLEVYNDINSELHGSKAASLVNLFHIVKHHPDALQQELQYLLNAGEQFQWFKSQDLQGLTDIQRSARFFFLVKASYGSNTREYGKWSRKVDMIKDIQEISKRLGRVVIENRSFEKIIRQYDRPHTLFYCDPPYYGGEKLYKGDGQEFTEEQHLLLKDTLDGIEGKFLLSYNDCPFIRQLYKDYHLIEISRQNNLTSRYQKNRQYKELIIKNY